MSAVADPASNASWIRGKNCMVTGVTNGIGRVTAIELAKMGARMFLVCRDRGRGDALAAEIAERTGNRDVTLLVGDLASQADIRRLAGEFLARGEPLHVLVNNAGVVNMNREITRDGIEGTFAVNHLAYFMLTMLLLDRIKQSAPARIVNVTSDLHQRGTMNFTDPGLADGYGWMRSYSQSKLANILFTYELARRLEGAGVTVTCCHPGAVATNLGKNNGIFARGVVALLGPFMRTPEKGARTQIWLASSRDVEGRTGKYYIDCAERQSSKESHDAEAARRLWEMSAKMTGVTA
ncbi:MAG TPA: SDR family oxidoreductase [Candidatus Binataceae bacterium]|nr:SDR family oxidoreductase [Candidatus Binataceae bacterium]